MDPVKVALFAGGTASLIALISGAVIAWENVGSRNLALASGTVAAAMILYLIQMPFELRRSDRVDHISTEFTIDRLQPEIRQWQYMNPSNRIHVEVSASELLAANNPNAFDGDRGKLTHDMVIFSLVGFLATEEFDWQIIVPREFSWYSNHQPISLEG